MNIFAWLGQGIEWLLVTYQQLLGNWGLAIIMLTLTIRLILYPVFASQTRNLVMMRKINPELKALQEKYKDKPQEYQKRMMEVYRKHKVNPLGGCLPLLIQLPILWVLFQVLRNFEFNQGFLWIPNLGTPDPLYILPVLAGATTYLQMAVSSSDPSQRTMQLIMPAFLVFISISLPAGLVIYWVVSNLVGVGQQYLIDRDSIAGEEGGVQEDDERGKGRQDGGGSDSGRPGGTGSKAR